MTSLSKTHSALIIAACLALAAPASAYMPAPSPAAPQASPDQDTDDGWMQSLLEACRDAGGSVIRGGDCYGSGGTLIAF